MFRASETSGRIVICLTCSPDKTAREETRTRGSVASARWRSFTAKPAIRVDQSSRLRTVQLQEGWQAKLTIGYLLVDAMCRGEYVPVGDEHTPAVLNRALSEKSCHPRPLFGIGRSTARDPRLRLGGGAASSGSSWFPRRLLGDRRVCLVPPNQFVRYLLLLLGT